MKYVKKLIRIPENLYIALKHEAMENSASINSWIIRWLLCREESGKNSKGIVFQDHHPQPAKSSLSPMQELQVAGVRCHLPDNCDNCGISKDAPSNELGQKPFYEIGDDYHCYKCDYTGPMPKNEK